MRPQIELFVRRPPGAFQITLPFPQSRECAARVTASAGWTGKGSRKISSLQGVSERTSESGLFEGGFFPRKL